MSGRAAIYVRVSSAGQEDNFSLGTQDAACRAYAHEHGYEVAAVYREVFTGVELWDRPQLTTLREAIRRHELDVVVVYAIDRLSRDPVHLGVIISEADHAGVEVLFVTEPLDHSPEGELIRFVRGYAAKIEHAKIQERAVRGRRARAQSGKLIVNRRALYGYRFKDETRGSYVEDERTAPIVQRIFRDASAGTSLRAIAATLTAEGIPTPTGRPQWGRSTVWQLLKNDQYTGVACAYRWGATGKNAAGLKVKTRARRPEAEVIPLPAGTVPRLVDAATFEAVQHRLVRNAEASARNSHHPEGALLRAGFAVCGYCGSTLRVETVTRGLRYVCGRGKERTGACGTHAILVCELDRDVWARVSAVLRDPDLIESNLRELRRNDPTAADLAAVDRQLAAVERQRENFLGQIGNAATPAIANLLLGRVATLTEDMDRLHAERERVAARRAAWDAESERLGDLKAWCTAVGANLAALSYQLKRAALTYLGVRVRLFRQDAPERFVIEAITITDEGEIVSNLTCRSGRRCTRS